MSSWGKEMSVCMALARMRTMAHVTSGTPTTDSHLSIGKQRPYKDTDRWSISVPADLCRICGMPCRFAVSWLVQQLARPEKGALEKMPAGCRRTFSARLCEASMRTN